MQKTQVRSLGWKDPLEKEMVTHSSFLAWEIPWTEDPSGLQKSGIHKSPQGHKRVGHDSVTKQQQKAKHTLRRQEAVKAIEVQGLCEPAVPLLVLQSALKASIWGPWASQRIVGKTL